jgi:probable rRNA maturation factor
VQLDLQINNQSHYPIDRGRLLGAVERVLDAQKLEAGSSKMEVSLLFVNKEQMAELNLKYHQTQGPTDVLSFPYTDPESLPEEAKGFVTPPDVGTVLGDIVVCYEVAEEAAVKEGKTVDEMMEFYVLHGLEHLLGHHHD